MGKRIVVMAGGTGGHVFPALAVAQLLLKKGWQVSWIGTQRGMESRVVPANGIDIDWVTVSGIRGKGMLAKIKAPWMLLDACFQALKILRRRQPSVVLGMGGFVAGPGGLMARMLGIPLVIHEQNRVPGTTNRLLAWFANVVLEAFPGSFDKNSGAICSGNPLREPIQMMQKQPRQLGSEMHILVLGGSQGAQILNEIVPQAVVSIPGVEVKHQTGKAMFDAVKTNYARLGIKATVLEFIEDMSAAYQWADMIICRAGAMTVSEAAAAGLPAILIPFPYAIDDHQTANARFLQDAGAGILLEQKNLSAATLTEQIKQMQGSLKTMAKAALSCARLDATKTVADVCIAEANR
jgi:UDP-N-acetylglucosamine--N-acetylmuramyl-(pentapeptide) pyrophosphoryl-undecaprenol N-acetylglucosamine transferase